MKFTNKDIGNKLMETITSGLYDGNLNCLREYVQNGIDAGAKSIEIYFENGNKDLIIHDDGSGMNREELAESLGIGISHKKGENAGWRGIGIWSGVPACKRIVIITKKENDNKHRIVIHNDKLWNGENKPVLDILTDATEEIEVLKLGKDESLEKNHFTVVRLESILPTQKTIFEEEKIRKYLSGAVPAPFDTKQFSFATEINKWLMDKGVIFPTVNVKFQGDDVFRPPCREDIFLSDIIKKEFTIDNKLIAVGWVLTSNKNEKLKPPNNGIYFKKKGFTLGDENLVLRQYNGTYHPWQYGEIHIVSKELRENAARNNFEYNNGIVEPFLEEIKEFIRQLEMLNHYQSSKIISRRIKTAQNYFEKGDLESANITIDKLNDSLTKTPSFPTEPSFNGMKPVIDNISTQNKEELTGLETELKQAVPSDTKKEKEPLINSVINNLCPAMKKSISRMTRKGLPHLEMSATDPIRELLEKKIGKKFDKNEIFELSQAAYGWKDVIHGNDYPLLAIDKEKLARNRRFGVMVYAVHDLFVNLCKHETGKDSFKWYEDAPKEEKEVLVAEIYFIIDFICRLIEKSEKYQP